MSHGGTEAHLASSDLPPLVRAAAEAAATRGFSQSCLPAQGRLLALLAAGVGAGRIGETGTGCGVGTAWLATGAAPTAELTSIDRDASRTEVARSVLAETDLPGPRIQLLTGDWPDLARSGPFDLLFLDGGGQGKDDRPPIELADWLRPRRRRRPRRLHGVHAVAADLPREPRRAAAATGCATLRCSRARSRSVQGWRRSSAATSGTADQRCKTRRSRECSPRSGAPRSTRMRWRCRRSRPDRPGSYDHRVSCPDGGGWNARRASSS